MLVSARAEALSYLAVKLF